MISRPSAYHTDCIESLLVDSFHNVLRLLQNIGVALQWHQQQLLINHNDLLYIMWNISTVVISSHKIVASKKTQKTPVNNWGNIIIQVYNWHQQC